SIAAVAQDRVAVAVDSLPPVKKIDQVAISPDGSQVAYIVEGGLSVVAVTGGTPIRIAPDQKGAVRDVTWSADSRHIAWLADSRGDVPASQPMPAITPCACCNGSTSGSRRERIRASGRSMDDLLLADLWS